MFDTDVWRIVKIVPEYISSIGTLLAGVGAIIGGIIFVPKLKDVIMLKDEILYGEEAKNRYESIKDMLPTTYPDTWGPVLWEGDQNTPHIFEVKRVTYDKNTMGIEWKGCKKSVRYIFKDDTGKMMVKGPIRNFV